jgi:integrase
VGPEETVCHFVDLLRPFVDGLVCAGAGLHDLRRLNATTLVVEGIDVKTAQTRLGHADPRVTLSIYASAPASVDRAAADVLGERFFGESGNGHSG